MKRKNDTKQIVEKVITINRDVTLVKDRNH